MKVAFQLGKKYWKIKAMSFGEWRGNNQGSCPVYEVQMQESLHAAVVTKLTPAFYNI